MSYSSRDGDGLFRCYDQHLAGFLFYAYPDSFRGITHNEQAHSNCLFQFEAPAGVNFFELKEQWHSPDSVAVSNTKALLKAVERMRKELFEYRRTTLSARC